MAATGAARASVRYFPEDWLRPMAVDRLFKRTAPLEIDIGCGKGRFLLAHAQRHPDINFLGVDRMLRRIRKIDRKAVRRELTNVRLLRADAYYTTAYLIPEESVSTYYILFPDPWPKKRHVTHRLFDPKYVDALHRTLEPGRPFHFATDHLPYFEAVREIMLRDKRFEEIPAFEPLEEERTDFERLYLNIKPIGRCSFRKR